MQQTEASRPRFSIILPARNEEQRIGKTLALYQASFAKGCEAPFEFIIVANACTDGTVEVVRTLAREDPIFRLLETERPGKGGAILEGFRHARGRAVAFCDSDGSAEPADLLGLLQRVDSGECDCAIGSRWLPDSRVPVPQPWRRRVASRLFNRIVRLMFGFSYKDTQCGAKAFNRTALEVLLKTVVSTGYHFDCELLWRLRQAGLRVLEAPITWRDQGGSGIRLGRDSLKMLLGLLRIRFQRSPRKGS